MATPGIDLNIEGDESQITAELVNDKNEFANFYKVECSLDSITILPQLWLVKCVEDKKQMGTMLKKMK